ncbi:TylF/MycF/NovP-related O-methyltransferase [uncultured Tateyamaria sp.]|uniref:TylF/MycF/NovP-related O-methyltransferase n=1 Tax=uncultured Tateyamaria sp. TaxID=455651 RepID=UPI00262FF96A|nr:TylF/MycF/NovP-related O-methyltransferase [uncultured Tateyamaria sp.]
MTTENVFPDSLLDDVRVAMCSSPAATFAVVGLGPAAYEVGSLFRNAGQMDRFLGVFDERIEQASNNHQPLREIKGVKPTYVVIAVDEGKNEVLLALEGLVPVETRILFAGSRQYDFSDSRFERALRTSLVPSFATGYPEVVIHLYECLRNAARLGLEGAVVEFGMFKGGTTMLLSAFIEELERDWPVIGFDTFSGFPPKRSLFDMYDHPDCHFEDLEAVRRLVSGRRIEVVPGDIVDTISRLSDVDVVLAFVDTDNYTPAAAAVAMLRERVVRNGTIVFDHYTGRSRHRYTLGERFAASGLEQDSRFFNLHGTGVFIRQR